jgi:uncharacterized protein (DUF983 family)
MEKDKPHRGYLGSVASCRCPRCREGKMFKNPVGFKLNKNMEMHRNCTVCGQAFELEVGFYYGTSYVSYALTVAISVISFIAWMLTIGISLTDNRFFYWFIFNALLLIGLQLWLMRLSRSIWISWFVKFDPNWKDHQPEDVSERLNLDQGGNW